MGLVIELLCPRRYVTSLRELDLHDLKSSGIEGIIFDLDNTVVEWNRDHVSAETLSWLDMAKALGFRMCILSNGLKRRIQRIAEFLGIPSAGGRSVKPMKGGFVRALGLLGTEPHRTAIVGDQVFTDVLGGNRLGLYTILVRPMTNRGFITTRLTRKIEQLVLTRFRQRGMLGT